MGGDAALVDFAINEFVIEEDDEGEEKEGAALEEVKNAKADVFISEGFATG